MWIQHPVWTGWRGAAPSGENALPAKTPRDTGRKRSAEGGDGSCRGDTRWYSTWRWNSTKQHVRRGRERRVKQEDERVAALSCCRGRGQAHGKHTWGLRPVSRGAYCRSTSAVLLTTSSKVLLLLGCLVPFRFFFLISSPPTPASFIMAFFFLRRLTSRRADSRTCWWCSCSGPALSSCRPPPGEGRRSPAPGRRRAPRSGSPSAAWRRASAWPPRCSWPAGSSTSHPVVGRVCWGVCGEESGGGWEKQKRRVEWERSVMWWERREWQKWGRGEDNSWIQLAKHRFVSDCKSCVTRRPTSHTWTNWRRCFLIIGGAFPL